MFDDSAQNVDDNALSVDDNFINFYNALTVRIQCPKCLSMFGIKVWRLCPVL